MVLLASASIEHPSYPSNVINSQTFILTTPSFSRILPSMLGFTSKRKAQEQPPQPKPIEPIQRQVYPRGYSVAEFIANPNLVKSAKEFMDSPLGGHILAALHNGLPSGYPTRGTVVNDTTANIELGRMLGYLDCLNVLYALATVTTAPSELEITYGADETQP